MSTEYFKNTRPFREEREMLNREIPQYGLVETIKRTLEEKGTEVIYRHLTPEIASSLVLNPTILAANHKGPEAPRLMISSVPIERAVKDDLKVLSSKENQRVYGEEVLNYMIVVDTFGQPNLKPLARLKQQKTIFMTPEELAKRKKDADETNAVASKEAVHHLNGGGMVGIFPGGEQLDSARWLGGLGAMVWSAKHVENAHVTLVHIGNTGAMDRRIYNKAARAVWPFHPVITYLDSIPVSQILEESKGVQLFDTYGRSVRQVEKISFWLQERFNYLAYEHVYNPDRSQTRSRLYLAEA